MDLAFAFMLAVAAFTAIAFFVALINYPYDEPDPRQIPKKSDAEKQSEALRLKFIESSYKRLRQ